MDISIEEVCKYGPLLEKNKNFPKGTNVNFVKIEDNNENSKNKRLKTRIVDD